MIVAISQNLQIASSQILTAFHRLLQAKICCFFNCAAVLPGMFKLMARRGMDILEMRHLMMEILMNIGHWIVTMEVIVGIMIKIVIMPKGMVKAVMINVMNRLMVWRWMDVLEMRHLVMEILVDIGDWIVTVEVIVGMMIMYWVSRCMMSLASKQTKV